MRTFEKFSGPSRRDALALGMSLVAGAAGPLSALRGAAAAELAPLRIATNVSESAANCYFAQEQGFFKDQGIDAHVESFASSGAYANGIVSGTFDIGAVASGSLVSAHTKGIPFVLLANGGVYNYQSPTTMLVVAKDSLLRNAADFKGKTIAVSTLGDIVQVAVMEWLDKNGTDYKSVNYVEIPPAVAATALNSGRIDAAFLGEPFVSESLDLLRVIAAPSTSVANHYLVTGWATSRAWFTANPALARSFQAAMVQASTWASKNRNAATDVLVKYAKIPPAVASRLHHVNWDPTLSTALIQPVIDAMAKYGIFAKSFPATELFS
jgi:NitT/TauT family transport system substrate-binding protein